MRTALIALTLLTSACARTTQLAPQTYLIECNGVAGMQKCVEQAQALCPRGYTVANASTSEGGGNVVWSYPTDGSAASYSVVPEPKRRSMTVTCN